MLLNLYGHRLYYDLTGPAAAPTVVFTHSLASDSGMWAEQLPVLLAAGYRVLRLDMRGHGGSDAVTGDYTMAALADDVAAALDKLEIDGVHFIGLSIGGMIGQGFALAHGARLKSLMLCDTAPGAPAGARQAWQDRVAAVGSARSLQPLADGTMERWFTAEFRQRQPARWRQIRDTVIGTTPTGFLGCAAAIQAFDFTPALPGVRLPTLVVCGAEDSGTPPSENRRLAGLIPGARFETIAAARHLPNVERPENFNRIMLDWLAAQR